MARNHEKAELLMGKHSGSKENVGRALLLLHADGDIGGSELVSGSDQFRYLLVEDVQLSVGGLMVEQVADPAAGFDLRVGSVLHSFGAGFDRGQPKCHESAVRRQGRVDGREDRSCGYTAAGLFQLADVLSTVTSDLREIVPGEPSFLTSATDLPW